MKCYAVILIAGNANRWKLGDKCLELIHGYPVALYSLKAFQASSIFDNYVFVYKNEAQRDILLGFVQQFFPDIFPDIFYAKGSSERHLSVFEALKFINCRLENDAFVWIHDGARPLITPKIVQKMHQALSTTQGVALAHRITETTVLLPDSQNRTASPENSTHRMYLNREQLWALETPQAFYFPQIYADYLYFENNPFAATDDTRIFSGKLQLVENNFPNIKLTHPEDYSQAAYHLELMNRDCFSLKS